MLQLLEKPLLLQSLLPLPALWLLPWMEVSEV
jgi:hypothetical protein